MLSRRKFGLSAMLALSAACCGFSPKKPKPAMHIWVNMESKLKTLGYEKEFTGRIRNLKVNGGPDLQARAFAINTEEGWVDCWIPINQPVYSTAEQLSHYKKPELPEDVPFEFRRLMYQQEEHLYDESAITWRPTGEVKVTCSWRGVARYHGDVSFDDMEEIHADLGDYAILPFPDNYCSVHEKYEPKFLVDGEWVSYKRADHCIASHTHIKKLVTI